MPPAFLQHGIRVPRDHHGLTPVVGEHLGDDAGDVGVRIDDRGQAERGGERQNRIARPVGVAVVHRRNACLRTDVCQDLRPGQTGGRERILAGRGAIGVPHHDQRRGDAAPEPPPPVTVAVAYV